MDFAVQRIRSIADYIFSFSSNDNEYMLRKQSYNYTSFRIQRLVIFSDCRLFGRWSGTNDPRAVEGPKRG